ncbi:hypothetical protein Tco_0604363 [Tanacetum coccineum]
MNKDKRVRFAEPVTSLSNISKQTDSLKIKDSNKPLLTSTGVKPTTSASGSKPSGEYGITEKCNHSISNEMVRIEGGYLFWNQNDDAHEHVERVLDIVSLFNIHGVSHDAVMLHVFPITLTGAAKRWVDRLPLGTFDFWDLLKKAFIQSHQKVNIFYNGLGTMNCQLLDSQGPIPSMALA